MSQKQPRYRHSWKKPWAFQDYHTMRRTITEREVYKKLLVLERHSSYKKPYTNYQSHPHGELIYSPPGWKAPNPNPGGSVGIIDDPGPTTGGCQMACNGGQLDCQRGGCDTITCICNEPPMFGVILEDPTGSAWIEGNGGAQLQVCIEPQKTDARYGEIIVEVTDSQGQKAITHHPMVDCKPCCTTYTITGAATVNPGADWEGTISPCCTSIEITVTGDCFTGSSSLSGDGCTVTVSVGDSDCGTFTVTATHNESGCDTLEASIAVRINNTGQGGSWVHDTDSGSLGLGGCESGDCGGGAVTNYGDNCIEGQYKYGGFDTSNACEGTWTVQCKGGDTGNPCTASGEEPPCTSHGCGCSGAYPCCDWSWWRCTWECSC